MKDIRMLWPAYRRREEERQRAWFDAHPEVRQGLTNLATCLSQTGVNAKDFHP